MFTYNCKNIAKFVKNIFEFLNKSRFYASRFYVKSRIYDEMFIDQIKNLMQKVSQFHVRSQFYVTFATEQQYRKIECNYGQEPLNILLKGSEKKIAKKVFFATIFTKDKILPFMTFEVKPIGIWKI